MIVRFADRHGRCIQPWKIIAGMEIVKTEYKVDEDALTCTLVPADRVVVWTRAQMFREWEAAIDDRRLHEGRRITRPKENGQ